MYKLIWEFKPNPNLRENFEAAYSSNGPWVELFGRAPGFLGSELLRNTDAEGTYLTVDSWRSQDDFESFKKGWKSEYEAMDRQMEALTISERAIGKFTTPDSSGGSTPILQTDRLILRAHRIEDFDDLAAMWADPLVVRYIGGTPSTRQQSWSRLLVLLGHWSAMGFGYWAVIERATGKYIGSLGYADYKRELQPSIEGTPEIGWALAASGQGKGYATEALKAVVAWGDLHFGQKRTVCMIHPDNHPSIRLAQKLGYQELVRTQYLGGPRILFARK